jgi:DNA-binding transcriptional LysR family regulator
VPDISPSSADFELRLVRYFAAIVDSGGFARAAESLHVAQPSLSRQIKKLEAQLGASLFDRGPLGATLTPAGQAFLPEALALLSAAKQAATTVQGIASPGRLTVGYVGSLVVTAAVKRLRQTHPEAVIEARHVDWDGVHTALLDRRVDAVVARMPFPADRLRVMVLYTEPRVLVVAPSHRLAARESVTVDDFADEPMPRFPDPGWNAFWRLDPRPDGRPAPDGPLVKTFQDKVELIAAGDAVAILPAGDDAVTLRRDLTAIPIIGIAPAQVVLATRANDRNRLLPALRRIAKATFQPAARPMAGGRPSRRAS